MDTESKQPAVAKEEQAKDTAQPDTIVGDASRRRFTRGAVLASGVMLTLGNRAAWSNQGNVCVSAATLTSFTMAANGVQPSVSPSTQAKIDEFQNLIDNEGYTSVPDGNGGACAEPPPP